MNRRDIFSAVALSAGAAGGLLALGAAPALAQAAATGASTTTGPSNLERILKAKKLRVAGLPGEEPYFSKDIASGAWSGFCIDMARDIAKELDVALEVVESTWGNSVLDLQAGKVDISFGLNPTPKRALAVDFTRPLFFNTFAIVSRKDFSADTWEALNRPEARVAVDLGSTHELIARRYAPRATITAYKTRDEAILAVQSGRADCFVCTIFLGLTSRKKNPALGAFTLVKPFVQASVCAAVPYDADRRFRDFVSGWCDFNRSNGQMREWIVAGLAKVNIAPDDVPPEVQF